MRLIKDHIRMSVNSLHGAARPGRAARPIPVKQGLPALGDVDKTSFQERLYRELKHSIMRGAFRPGQVITIQELADAFGTSAMPARSALSRLVAEHALVVLQNRSVAVPTLTAESFRDLLWVRQTVEGAAARQAAEHVTAAEVAALDKASRRIGGMIQPLRLAPYLAANQEFHFGIYRASRSETVLRVIEGLWLRAGPYLNLLQHAGELQIGNHRHEEAVAALKLRDGDRIEAAIRNDLEDAAKAILRLVQDVEDGRDAGREGAAAPVQAVPVKEEH